MRKLLLTLLLCVSMAIVTMGQKRDVDSLRIQLANTNNDTLHLVIHKMLAAAFQQLNFDSALVYAKHYLSSAQRLQYTLNEADALRDIAAILIYMNNSAGALELLFRAMSLVENSNRATLLPAYYLSLLKVPKSVASTSQYRTYVTANVHLSFSIAHWANGSDKNFDYVQKAIEQAKSVGADDILSFCYVSLGAYLITTPDTALPFLQKAYTLALKTGKHSYAANAYAYMAWGYHNKGDHLKEQDYRRAALAHAQVHDLLLDICWNNQGLAEVYEELKMYDSAFYYANKAFKAAQQVRLLDVEMYASNMLFKLYRAQNKQDSALKYLEMKTSLSEKIFNLNKARQFQNVDFNQQVQQNAREVEKVAYQNKIKAYVLLAGLLIVLLIAGLLWRNNRHKQKAYALVQQQKQQTVEAYEQLKATQQQLIQKEKMASLGELTAGIAHEIQNPLNFVNNFSVINTELLGELQLEVQNGNVQEVMAIASNIKANEEKISYHGRRADGIVKGMLQHSRSATGEREPTVLNALVEQYLQLAYHGYRARNKNFNVDMSTRYDQTIGTVNLVPQEIGSVLLNVFNNAFYAIQEKAAKLDGTYEPKVWVSTRKEGNSIRITVGDNGTGMPSGVAEKVFQPFFTTKPTGEGTGLGMSLSFDIVTKGYGGELTVATKEGEYTTFVICLPLAMTENITSNHSINLK